MRFTYSLMRKHEYSPTKENNFKPLDKFSLFFPPSAWKQRSDALDAQHDTVVSIWNDLDQSVSASSQVYHHLKGSCLEDFEVQSKVIECCLYVILRTCISIHHRYMFSGRFISWLLSIAMLYRQTALRKLPRNIHVMTSEMVCMYILHIISYVYNMLVYKEQAI